MRSVSRPTPLALPSLGPSADWASTRRCLQAHDAGRQEQSTSPAPPASAEIQNNLTAAQASGRRGGAHSSGDNSATTL